MTGAIGPIVITGLDRSGKTALRAILDSSREIAFIRRSYLWTRIHGRFGDLGDDRNLVACVAALRRHPELQERGVDIDAVAREMHGGPRTYGHLFQRIGSQIAASTGRSRWGAQEGGAESSLRAIFEAFPTARVVHMVRDPRDRHADLVSKRRSAGMVALSARRWRESVRAIADDVGEAGARCHIVRYEDLLAQPASTVTEVCAFIGEPEPERLASTATAWIGRAGIDYDRSLIGSWTTRIPAWEGAYLQAHLGDEMASFGYASVPITLSASERLRCFAAAPIGVVTAAVRSIRPHARRPGSNGTASRRGEQ